MMRIESQTQPVTARERTVLDEVLEAIRKVQYGYVQVVIQDSRVVQIDTTEKKRIDRARE